MSDEQRKPGRPRIEIDETLLKKLSQLHLPKKVMADVLGVSVDTLDRNFADKIELFQSESKSKIAAALFDEAINKREPWALKSLAQKHLDYSDKQQVEHSGVIANTPDEELDAKIATMMAPYTKKEE